MSNVHKPAVHAFCAYTDGFAAGATYTSYSPLYYQTGNLTKSFPVTNSTLRTGRANLALGR